MALHARSIAYAATTLGATMMHSVFMFYYVKVYLNKYHVSEGWFQFAQVLFMVWNAINDPLFGYVQDNYDFSWVKSRRHSILYGTPLFALSFVLPWFPWGDYETYTWLSGFQLLVALCFYDAMFTFVLLAQSALFAEMSSAHEDRLRLVRYSQVGSLVGSSSVFLTGLVSSNLQFYGAFQMCCLVIGLFAMLCLTYSGLNAHSQYDKTNKGNGTPSADGKLTHSSENSKTVQYTMLQQIYQIFTSRDFLCFVTMNFCQVYHVNFLVNFANVFCDVLISGEHLPATQRSFYYGSLSVMPQVIVITFSPIVRRLGYYKVVKCSFVCKMAMGTWVFMFGHFWWGIAIFFFFDWNPLSSMVFGANALITKPAQSVAPMLTVAILNRYGYNTVDPMAGPASAPPDLQWAMVMVAAATSLTMGTLQSIIWSLYRIRNSHSTLAKYVET